MSVSNLKGAAGVTLPLVDVTALSVGSSNTIATATTLLPSQSGQLFVVSQAAAYAITLPAPSAANVGLRYQLVVGTAGANNVTVTAGAGAFVGTIVNGASGATASTISSAGTTLTFATGAAVVGDHVELLYVSATLVLVKAFTSNAAGITITA
jgi:hypothetical protein